MVLNFFVETFNLGVKNIHLHKLRSLLTTLGIIFGVSAVIIMVAIGEGTKQAALDQVKGVADFAAVARKVSEDTGSAAQGGDLGCSPRGRMVPEFDNVAFDAQAFDQNLGLPGLHKVRPKVAVEARRTILPPDLFARLDDLSFWRDLSQSAAHVIAASPSPSARPQPVPSTQLLRSISA